MSGFRKDGTNLGGLQANCEISPDRSVAVSPRLNDYSITTVLPIIQVFQRKGAVHVPCIRGYSCIALAQIDGPDAAVLPLEDFRDRAELPLTHECSAPVVQDPLEVQHLECGGDSGLSGASLHRDLPGCWNSAQSHQSRRPRLVPKCR
jgi:hypothetical protein